LRYFLYRRVGTDERVLALLPGWRIGQGGTEWERGWRLEEEQGRRILVIEGKAGDTCRLRQQADGGWRGRWLHHQQLPVELLPLGAGSPEWGPAGSSRATGLQA
jgi:hypothetical protein